MAGSISNQIVPDKASAFFADETISPLLSKDGATAATSVISDERELGTKGSDDVAIAKPTNAQKLKSVVALLVSVAGAAASIASFLVATTIIVYVAGCICLMNLPIVTYREKKILFLPSRRRTVDQLQSTAKLLKSEADILEEEIEYLVGHASRFGKVEQELQEVAQSQGSSIDEIVHLVRENEEMMDLMRENLRQKVIQDVIAITIRSDKGNNQGIDRVEAKLLALKITVKLEAYGVVFNEDKFLQAVALTPTLWGVAGTVRKLLPWDEELDDASAASNKDDTYDMFYMSREDQQRRGSAVAHALSATHSQASFESRYMSLARSTPVRQT
eukprot:CAMPEP_0172530492 /NCGR_PEP_ID=MMETSP1067-20121228/4213_1 /TAXON_ID=265564 ORGANISM="Thalassiosira punctigera, Strain Tpunct2005C2" /NCGR_SAMPLE_ID=MMETSP1067 /ASSEMBLY_ACC=CAM_ASM_000444 /LENGTH=330 /DNA_ID=CAMNT_0013314711 /DNA_START=149 /DNA_END=1141 /DNA_ORIENTATION=+